MLRAAALAAAAAMLAAARHLLQLRLPPSRRQSRQQRWPLHSAHLPAQAMRRQQSWGHHQAWQQLLGIPLQQPLLQQQQLWQPSQGSTMVPMMACSCLALAVGAPGVVPVSFHPAVLLL
jgi:hypothetical protein